MINNRYINVVLMVVMYISVMLALNFWFFSKKADIKKINYLTTTVFIASKLSDAEINPKIVTATKRYLVVYLGGGEIEEETFDVVKKNMFLFNFLAIKINSSEHPFHLESNTLPCVVEIKTGTEIKFLLDYPESFRDLKINDDFKNTKIIFKYAFTNKIPSNTACFKIINYTNGLSRISF